MGLRREHPMKFSGPVVLIGGNGDVGKRLVPMLLDHVVCPVLLVSRRGGTSHDAVEALQFDISAEGAADKLPPGATVVNLTEATPPSVAAQVVRAGGIFLDTSATPDYVRALRQAMADAGGPGTGVLCVGTAPGLSTLMAADAAGAEGTEVIDIGVELGMGRHYGKAATEWSINAFGAGYRLSGDENRTVRPGDVRRRFAFGQNECGRATLGVGFPVDGIAEYRVDVAPPLVRTFLALDPPWMTRLVGLLLRFGLGPVLARRKRGLTRFLMRLPELGQARTRIAVEAHGANGEVSASRHFTGGDQADVTAAMILATICVVHTSGPVRGATTVSDHLSLDRALNDLRGLLRGMAIKAWSTGS